MFHSDLSQFLNSPDPSSDMGPFTPNVTMAGLSDSLLAPSGTPPPASPEFINFIFALLCFSLRYPAVFWHTSKPFSLLFSVHLVLNSAHALFTFCSMAVLYKVQVNSMWFTEVSLVVPRAGVLGLHIVGGALIFFASLSVFNYGFSHYLLARQVALKQRYLQLLQQRGQLQQQQTSYPDKQLLSLPNGCCQGYAPHMAATGFLVAIVLCRAPLVYDCVSVYRNYSGFADRMLLSSLLCDVIYMLFWIILWFCFTLRQSWTFQIISLTAIGEENLQLMFYQNEHIPQPQNIQTVPSNGAQNCGRSSMRKSTSTNGSHVTFRNDAFDGEEPPTEDVPIRRRRSGERQSSGRKRRSGGGQENAAYCDSYVENETSAADTTITTTSDGVEKEPMTPDNTITRHYRHSIRNKCGQYYKRQLANERELEEADHSIRSSRRNDEKASSSNASPVKPEHKEEPVRQRSSTSSTEEVPAIPPRVPCIDGRPKRQQSPINQARKHQPSPVRDRPAPPYTSRHVDQPPARPPRDFKKPPVNRTLQLGGPGGGGSDKRDMGRRDSALPSSNETSSNDSEDNVLCSEV